MPFKSKAQQGFLFSKKPGLAKEFASKMESSDYKKLPEKASKKSVYEKMKRKGD